MCTNGVCSAPGTWTCAAAAYDEEGQGVASPNCDCACGSLDPDCADPFPVTGCAPGEACDGAGNCDVAAPPGWNCDPTYYGDALCDCGCGVFDAPDCADLTVGVCEYCNDPGSCGTDVCPANIDPTNNATCI